MLVEILVSLAVVAIVLGALLQVYSHSLRNANAAKRVQLASYLAERIVWEALWTDPVEEGWENGSFEEEPQMTWSREIRLLYRPDLEEETPDQQLTEEDKMKMILAAGGREKLPPTDLFQIRVYVNWMERGQEKNYELSTYRLAPTPEGEEDQIEI